MLHKVAMIAGVMILSPGAAQAGDGVAMPAWLAGAWCTEGPVSDRTCEYWTPESGGLMIGASITMKRGKPVEFEQIRIVEVDKGKPFYFATPNGGTTVPFEATGGYDRAISFENRSHDYPQKISYRRDGDTLTAEISLADGSKPMRWRYTRVAE